MNYDITIGLEIHAELNTNSKIFCGCRNSFSTLPNSNCCPVCLGMPGSLPVLNRMAVEKTILAGHAMGCQINDIAIFERKNYFYPDLPKAYQISQMKKPICLGGEITLTGGKTIHLNRIHLEEDAGKLIHDEVNGVTLIDYNRGGAPLIEIVSEPDISSAIEAVEFLEEIRSRLIFSGVANCKMEEGGLRCDVNISLKKKGEKKLGNRVELKNLSSFKMVARAIEFETKRQTALLDEGKRISVETRKWNDAKGTTSPMRSKETEIDYRYFPDPDQCPIHLSPQHIERIRKTLPPLAHEYREKFVKEYLLPAYDADILTREHYICDFYLKSIALLSEPKKVSNWLMTNILAKSTGDIKISPKQFTDVIKLTDSRKISRANALLLIDELWDRTEKDAETTAKAMKILGGISIEELSAIINEIFATNPSAVADYKVTPDKVVNFFMGQTMKRTGGMADSIVAKEIILKKLM